MLPYSGSLILDNGSNYGIVKTEAVFGFGQRNPDNFVNVSLNDSEPLEWMITPLNGMERRSFQESSRAFKDTEIARAKPQARNKKKIKKKLRKKLKRKGKVKKCIFKLLKKGKKHKGKKHGFGMKKKYLMPLILGLLAAKSVLIPIALKALAFISAKGFLMGFFSTILASFLSLKGMFDHNHRSYQDRKDEKTQVEIIQVPAKSNEHSHYYDDHYKRGDYIPLIT